MAADFDLQVQGLDELLATLRGIPDKLRSRPIRNALAAGARIVRNAAQAGAPTLKTPSRYRTAGTVRNAIKVRTSKRAKAAGDVGVFVSVKPLSGKQITAFKRASGRGAAKNPRDPFYWRWIEFGWNPASGPRKSRRDRLIGASSRRKLNRSGAAKQVPGSYFLTNAGKRLPEALKAFEQSLGPQINKLNDKLSADL